MSVRVPPLHKGWMRKQGRKGVIKNWKKRFFVLEFGKISYFESESKEYPFGIKLKGTLILTNTEISMDPSKVNNKQIFIESFNGENSLLIEMDTEQQAEELKKNIKEHIKYANEHSEAVANPSLYSKKQSIDGYSSSDEESIASCTGGAKSPDTSGSLGLRKHQSVNISRTQEKPSPNLQKHKSIAITHSREEPKVHFQEPTIKDESEELELSSLQALLMGVVEQMLNLFMEIFQNLLDSEYRSKWLSTLLKNLTSSFSSLYEDSFGGEFGQRGEELIFIESVIILSVFNRSTSYTSYLFIFLLKTVGFLIFPIGLVMMLLGWSELGTNSSLFLYPVKENSIVDSGVYQYVRHPIYGGLLLFLTGISFYSGDMHRIVLTAFLFLMMNYIVRMEEYHLRRKHKTAYLNYAHATPKKFFPFIY